MSRSTSATCPIIATPPRYRILNVWVTVSPSLTQHGSPANFAVISSSDSRVPRVLGSAPQRGSGGRDCIKVFHHRLEQTVRHVLRDLSMGYPSQLSPFLGGRDVCDSCLHLTGRIGHQSARHRVNPHTEQLHRSHVQSCLLTGLPHSGVLSGLTRLNLADWELPGELALPDPAAHHENASLLNDYSRCDAR